MSNISILERKIDSIFAKLEQINEGISYTNKSKLRKGFDDGVKEYYEEIIKEGIGSWLGKKAGKAVNLGKRAKEKTKDFYNQGKELAKDTWSSIAKWAEKQLTRFENMVFKGLDYITSVPYRVDRAITKAVKYLFNKMISAHSYLSKKGGEFADGVVKIFNKFIELMKKMYRLSIEKITDAKEWCVNNYKALSKLLTKYSNESIEWLSNTAQETYGLLIKIKDGAVDASKVASKVILFLIIAPFYYGAKGIKLAVDFMDKLFDDIKEFWEQESQAFKASYQEEITEKFKHIISFKDFK